MSHIKLFLSQRSDLLVDQLIDQLSSKKISPLEPRTIFVPNSLMKQWLLLEIAKRTEIAMGLKVVEVETGIFQKSLSSMELVCLIYQALSGTTDQELKEYLDGKSSRLLDLSKQLAALFFEYGKWGISLFDPKVQTIDWQHALLQKLFVSGPWRSPLQILPFMQSGPVHCFGVDLLPPVYWDFLFRSTEISIYHFSPCIQFWGDICSVSERKSLNRYWKKRGSSEKARSELDLYLREAPPLLANWGRVGRETLQVFESYEVEVQECYAPLETNSLLKALQSQILNFEKKEELTQDGSIKVFMTGSSLLKEVECLREEILRLTNEEGILLNEISVLAPSIEPYVPLIEFIFGDEIPYRISGFDIAPQSSFRQGLLRLLSLVYGRWEGKELVTLFETPSFYRKRNWDEGKLLRFCSWIDQAKIKWGVDHQHRDEFFMQTLGHSGSEKGSWEKGLDRLLDSLVYISRMQINADEFEEFLVLIESLKKHLFVLRGEKRLHEWADRLEFLVDEFLQIDPDAEADSAARSSFLNLLHDLRHSNHLGEGLFPFALIQQFIARPCLGQIHPSHLHAVRFAPIEEASLIPAKALFMMGMDEENFPRLKISSSLDLLKHQTPQLSDQDRYHFLQALFSAKEFLRISYCHLSADEGKPVGPSLILQELLTHTGIQQELYHSSRQGSQKKEEFFWPGFESLPELNLPTGEVSVSISDLRLLARHPWKFFLQKVHGIYLNETVEDSFNLLKGRLVRKSLENSVNDLLLDDEIITGPIGEAIRIEVREKANEWKNQLSDWGLGDPFKLNLNEGTPLEILMDNGLRVKIIGEIQGATRKGFLSTNEDNIGGLLKCWPEALALAFREKTPSIFILKSRKIKILENVEENLKLYLEYYFRCLHSPSPLLIDWADSFLRKSIDELAKKVDAKPLFNDPVYDWVLARAKNLEASKMIQSWGPYLKEVFGGLVRHFPSRSKS